MTQHSTREETARIAELEAERDQLVEQIQERSPSMVERNMQAVMEANNSLLARAESAERDLAKAREALEFYRDNWVLSGDGDASIPGGSRTWREPNDALWDDEGRNARAVLAALPTQEAAAPGVETEKDRLIEQLHAKLTCMCGSEIDKHSIWDGHSPVSMYDYSLHQAHVRIEELETQIANSTTPVRKLPCGECRLHASEICDICGARQVEPDPDLSQVLGAALSRRPQP